MALEWWQVEKWQKIAFCAKLPFSQITSSYIIRNREECRMHYICSVQDVFRESHTPGIQTSTNESVPFKYLIVGVVSRAS